MLFVPLVASQFNLNNITMCCQIMINVEIEKKCALNYFYKWLKGPIFIAIN